MGTRMQQRRGTAAEWAAANPVLASGELGFETDTKIIKIGDGVSTWTQLNYGITNTVKPVSSNQIGLTVQGLNSQSADLQEWQDSTATWRARVGSTGDIVTKGYVGAGGMSFAAAVSAAALNSTSPAMLARGVSGQSANLQEWQNSAATVLAKVGNNGSGDFVSQIRKGTSTISHAGGNRWFNTDININNDDILQASYRDQYGNVVMMRIWAYAANTVYVGNDATPATAINGNTIADGTTVYWTIIRGT